ncbi:MAG: hypothetical protein O3C57_03270, partial [Verrucomicrobia bacterium]|nr:hypothetical protein [Verrucomicrobiota bacterium]
MPLFCTHSGTSWTPVKAVLQVLLALMCAVCGAHAADHTGYVLAPLIVTNQLILNNKIAVTQTGGGGTFTFDGDPLLSPTNPSHRSITLSGGTLTIGNAIYPTAGLIGRWSFDTGTAEDDSGNNYHGIARNSPTYDESDTGTGGGKSLVQNGSSYVDVDTGGSQSV